MSHPNVSNDFTFIVPKSSDSDTICNALLRQIGRMDKDAWAALKQRFTPSGGDALMTQALDQCRCGQLPQEQLEAIAEAIELASHKRGNATTVSRQMFPAPVGRRQSAVVSRPPSITAPPRASTWPEHLTTSNARRSLGARRRLPSPSPHRSTASVNTVIEAVVLQTSGSAPPPLRRKPPAVFK